jgi:N-acetylmuramoyl-L-alanine amidase
MKHTLLVTARRWRWLPWPTKTATWEKDVTCSSAKRMARQLRDGGARVTVFDSDGRECT